MPQPLALVCVVRQEAGKTGDISGGGAVTVVEEGKKEPTPYLNHPSTSSSSTTETLIAPHTAGFVDENDKCTEESTEKISYYLVS